MTEQTPGGNTPRKPARKPANKPATRTPAAGAKPAAKPAAKRAAAAKGAAAAAKSGTGPGRASARTRAKAEDAVASALASTAEAVEAEQAATVACNEAIEAREAADEAGAATARLVEELDPDDPLLDTAIRQLEAGADDDNPFGAPGKPLSTRSPFRVAFIATCGVLVALLLARAVIAVRDVLVLIVVSAFLAVGLTPGVELLQRRGLKRGWAVAVIMSTVALFFVGFVAAAAPPVAKQVGELREELPEYSQRFRENKTYRDLDDQFQITARITEAVKNTGTEAAGKAIGILTGALAFIFKVITVLILTLYFLSSYQRIKRGAYRLIPRSRRARVGLIADEILSRVGGYVLGNIATSMVAGVTSFVVFLVLDIPYAIALAMLVAILDLIPLVGATIAAVVCTIVAFFTSTFDGVAILIFFTIYQQLENYVIVPKVMKRTVDVSPLATIVAALVGGSLLGVIGALLAVPAAAAIQLIGTEVFYPRQDAA